MELKYSEIFNKTILKSVSEYCKLNSIEDVDGFIKKCFDTGFNIQKYGLLGKTLNEDEKHLKTDEIGEKNLRDSRKTCGIEEKRAGIEVIREKRAEVPVEVIREVEKIVTKIEYISDKTGEDELFGKIEQLNENIFHLNEELESERKIFSTKTEEMENNFHYEMSKKESELYELRRNLDVKVDNKNEKMLQETLQKLRKEMSNKDEKIKELEKINNNLQDTTQNNVGAIFLRGSNLNNRL
jgi:predicted RNase H-like nuclease (RuvC/YqgF family)